MGSKRLIVIITTLFMAALSPEGQRRWEADTPAVSQAIAGAQETGGEMDGGGFQQGRALSSEELLSIMEAAAGRQFETYTYVDMNHDGAAELIGTYCGDRERYTTWYCSSDGSICKLVHQNDDWMDGCVIELLDLGQETHVVLNAYRMMGTGKNYTILALRDNGISCILSNRYGYVRMDEHGDITLDVETYDGLYDPEIDSLIMHTWKDTYLYFDGKTYKEFGAARMPESAFLEFAGAAERKGGIEQELTQTDTVDIEYSYFIRANGILHVQCAVHNVSGQISYRYYPLRYSGRQLVGGLGEAGYGQMDSQFSDLEVIY